MNKKKIVIAILVVGSIVFFIKNSKEIENNKEMATTKEVVQELQQDEEDSEEGYVDEFGVTYTKVGDEEIAIMPEDTRKYSVLSDDMLSMMLVDFLSGTYIYYNYPISQEFISDFYKKGMSSFEKKFPGFERNEYAKVLGGDVDSKTQTFFCIVRANKYQDIRYYYKYTINEKNELAGLEYLKQEVEKDYTKEIEKLERTYLMTNVGDEIHNNNEFVTVLANLIGSMLVEEWGLDNMAIIDELKEKKYKENVIPIPNDTLYMSICDIDNTSYEKKVAEFYVRTSGENEKYEKYKIKFDYNEEYYLTEFEVVSQKEVTEEEIDNYVLSYNMDWVKTPIK